MSEVTDREGDVWHPVLDIGALREIEDRTGCALLSRPGLPEDTPGPQELFRDLDGLVVAVAVCCRHEVESRGLTVEALVERFQRGPIAQLTRAFNEEFAAFTGIDMDDLQERAEGGTLDRPPQAGGASGDSAPLPAPGSPGDSDFGNSRNLPNGETGSPGAD